MIEIAGSQGDYKITTPNNVSIINPHTGRAELLSPAVHAWPRAQSPYVQQQAAPPPNNGRRLLHYTPRCADKICRIQPCHQLRQQDQGTTKAESMYSNS